jgi:oligopeptide transport system permease protein
MWARRYMVDQQSADYIKFARAKGLSEKEISRKHIFKNAAIPVVNGILRRLSQQSPMRQ